VPSSCWFWFWGGGTSGGQTFFVGGPLCGHNLLESGCRKAKQPHSWNSPFYLEEFSMTKEPMSKLRQEYAELIEHISLPESPVGIDAKLTHAIIIDYLQQITSRLNKIELQLNSNQ
jgi:hypothetical protein